MLNIFVFALGLLERELPVHNPLEFVECVRFNELENGSIFDFRTAIGIMYEVTAVTSNYVTYKRLGDYFDETISSEYRIASGVVGLYKRKGVCGV